MRNLCAVTILACLTTVAGASGPDAGLPPFLDARSLPSGLQALAVNQAGDRVAIASLDDPEARTPRSTVRLHSSSGGEPTSVRLTGVVRALLFVEPDSVLYALQHRPAKKREGDTTLVAIDFDSPAVRRAMRLPPTAYGLGYWPRENALLVAVRNEIRTLLLPLMRSGPLFRIPGENLAVVAVGGTRILVGQDVALLDVDLADPPGRDRFPVRQSIEVGSPVSSLALSADGAHVFAGTDDNTTIVRIALDPLRIEETRPGVLPSRSLGEATVHEDETEPIEAPAPEPAPKMSDEPIPDEVVADADPGPDAPERPPVRRVLETPAAPAPATTGELVLDDAPTETPASPGTTERPAAHGAFEVPPVREESAPPSPRDSAQARGSLSGPATDLVVAVVFLGPDNVLREAARAIPSDRRWEIEGLEPGRYRVQIDGGGSRVLITEPPFLILDIAEGQPTQTVEFNVFGTR